MFTYIQSTGYLYRDGIFFASCYSGHGTGMDNPFAESMVGIGPIPQNEYTIGPWEDVHEHLGPVVAPLIPKEPRFGRSGFFIHGDNPQLNHTASDGCIIASRHARELIRDSKDTQLIVKGFPDHS